LFQKYLYDWIIAQKYPLPAVDPVNRQLTVTVSTKRAERTHGGIFLNMAAAYRIES